MLAGLERGGGLLGMEVRRALDGHGIEPALEQGAIPVESGEAGSGLHRELVAQLLDAVGEVVVQRNHLRVGVLLEQTADEPSAPAASDDSQLQPRVGLRPAHRRRRHDGDAGGRLQELASTHPDVRL